MYKKEEKIIKYKEKAEDAYIKHNTYCDKILIELHKLFPNEKEKIIDVIMQSSDGICVIYEDIKNIPLLNFIKGIRA